MDILKTTGSIVFAISLLFFSCGSAKKTETHKPEEQENLSPVEVTNIHPNSINSEESEVCFTIDTCVAAYEAKIFNRWSATVWHSTLPGECWKGLDAKTAKRLPQGAYYLYVNWTACDGQRKQYKGPVYILSE